MESLLAFVLAGLALTGSPGPATISLAAAGAAFGARRGLGYMCGILVGTVVVMVIAATGMMGLLLALPGARPVAIAVTAAYFAYLALRIATAPPLAANAGQNGRPTFAGGMFLALVNPKGYAVMAALFSGFVLVQERAALDAALKMIILLAIMIVIDLAWLVAGAALTHLFRDPGTHRAINVTFAVLLIASAAAALLF